MNSPPKISDTLLNRLNNLSYKMCYNSTLRCRHSSFILYKNKVISTGINNLKTDTFAAKNGYKYPFQHSEMVAIKKIKNIKINKSKLILVNIRNGYNKQLYSAPCKNCRRLAKKYGIVNIYFSTEDGMNFLKL